jgi:hypothetical protein
MIEPLYSFKIQNVDVMHALMKWDGRDAERRWEATDREFFLGFSAGDINELLIKRFAENNNNDVPSRRTGGYSIKRKFSGGLSSWTPRLKNFYTSIISPARYRYSLTESIEVVWELITQLAEMKGQARKESKPRNLGIVAASKLPFFACPEMPFFINDSFVRKALSMERFQSIRDYPKWWIRCNEILELNSSVIPLLPKERQREFLDKEDWLKRRSLDLMLYRFGEKINQGGNRSC